MHLLQDYKTSLCTDLACFYTGNDNRI